MTGRIRECVGILVVKVELDLIGFSSYQGKKK